MLKKIQLSLILLTANFIFNSTPAITHQEMSERRRIISEAISDTQIAQIVQIALKQANINVASDGLYSTKKIQLKYNSYNYPYLLIYLQNRIYFTSSMLRVNLDTQLQIISIQKNYDLNHLNDINFKKENRFIGLSQQPHCPDENIKFLFAAPFDIHGNQSVEKALEIVYPLAIKKYGDTGVKLLLDSENTLENFSNYLTCPNLEGIFSTASHSEIGQSFYLYDQDFDYTFFKKNRDILDYSKAMISFNTCYAFDDTLPGLCEAITDLSPKFYTSGVTPLPIWGGPETYACFWEKILGDDAKPTKALLNECAQAHDPFVKNSHSPLYILGAHDWDAGDNVFIPATISTTLGTKYEINADETYLRLKLAANEQINSITLKTDGSEIKCSLDSDLLTDGLRGAQFLLIYNNLEKNCLTIHLKPDDMPEQFPTGHAVYGFFPEEKCKSNTTILYSSEIKMQQGASERRVYKREAHTQATSNDAAHLYFR